MSLLSFLLLSLCSSSEKKCDFLKAAFQNSKGSVFKKLCQLLSKNNEDKIHDYVNNIILEKKALVKDKIRKNKEAKQHKSDSKGLRN